jgi:hypothetical protein
MDVNELLEAIQLGDVDYLHALLTQNGRSNPNEPDGIIAQSGV